MKGKSKAEEHIIIMIKNFLNLTQKIRLLERKMIQSEILIDKNSSRRFQFVFYGIIVSYSTCFCLNRRNAFAL